MPSLEFRLGSLSPAMCNIWAEWHTISCLIVGLEIWPPQLNWFLPRALVCGTDTDNNCVKPWDLNWLWLMNLLTWEFFTSFCLAPRLCKCWLHSPKSHWVSAWPSSFWSVSWPDPPLLLGAPHQAGPDRSKTRLRGFGAVSLELGPARARAKPGSRASLGHPARPRKMLNLSFYVLTKNMFL